MPNTKPWWAGIDQTDPRFAALASENSMSGPAYDRVTSIPDWLPKERAGELESEYGKIGERFDTSAFDRESEGQQSRLLTTALNAGNNAATEYANRARQSGGSGMGAGLVKALASVGARKSAGELALEQQKFDASQREKAAGLAGQIATTLGTLRDSYLRTIVDYATKEDSISAELKGKQIAADAANFSTASSRPREGFNAIIPNNMGLANGIQPFAMSGSKYTTPPQGWTPGQNWNFNRRG